MPLTERRMGLWPAQAPSLSQHSPGGVDEHTQLGNRMHAEQRLHHNSERDVPLVFFVTLLHILRLCARQSSPDLTPHGELHGFNCRAWILTGFAPQDSSVTVPAALHISHTATF